MKTKTVSQIPPDSVENIFFCFFKLILKIHFRHNSAVGEREELERELRNLRENVDECTLTRVDLERKLLTLREELEFENMVHQEVYTKNQIWQIKKYIF